MLRSIHVLTVLLYLSWSCGIWGLDDGLARTPPQGRTLEHCRLNVSEPHTSEHTHIVVYMSVFDGSPRLAIVELVRTQRQSKIASAGDGCDGSAHANGQWRADFVGGPRLHVSWRAEFYSLSMKIEPFSTSACWLMLWLLLLTYLKLTSMMLRAGMSASTTRGRNLTVGREGFFNRSFYFNAFFLCSETFLGWLPYGARRSDC